MGKSKQINPNKTLLLKDFDSNMLYVTFVKNYTWNTNYFTEQIN